MDNILIDCNTSIDLSCSIPQVDIYKIIFSNFIDKIFLLSWLCSNECDVDSEYIFDILIKFDLLLFNNDPKIICELLTKLSENNWYPSIILSWLLLCYGNEGIEKLNGSELDSEIYLFFTEYKDKIINKFN